MKIATKIRCDRPLHFDSYSDSSRRSQTAGPSNAHSNAYKMKAWKRWSVSMALRVFFFTCLLLLGDGQPQSESGSCSQCTCTYVYGQWKVNCSERGLRFVPSNLPFDVMDLDLSRNFLTSDQLANICQFKSLQYLSLSYNSLNIISGVFEQCSSLQVLRLSGNCLHQIGTCTLAGLKNLKSLIGLEVLSFASNDVFKQWNNLDHLELIFHGEDLPPGLFDGVLIQSLDLVLTKSNALPRGIFASGQGTMHTLNFVGENITEINDGLSILTEGLYVLRELHLTLPHVIQLPENFFSIQHHSQNQTSSHLQSLQKLKISGTSVLPPKLFSPLVNLQHLTLQKISSFSQGNFQSAAIGLQELVIKESKLVRIPGSWFKELFSLKFLTILGVQLEELHEDAFHGLTALTDLDLSNNVLKCLPGQLLRHVGKTLINLILHGNELNEIDDKMLNGLHVLSLLDVSYNTLTRIDPDAFRGLKDLSVLYLNNNLLPFLPTDLFRDQLKLQHLSLADNYLTNFPMTIVQLKMTMQYLDLSSNQLYALPGSQLCQFTNLESISMMNNYFLCDCTLLAVKRCPRVNVDGICTSPAQLSGKHFSEIQIPTACKSQQQVFVSDRPNPSESESKEEIWSNKLSTVLGDQDKTVVNKSLMYLFSKSFPNALSGHSTTSLNHLQQTGSIAVLESSTSSPVSTRNKLSIADQIKNKLRKSESTTLNQAKYSEEINITEPIENNTIPVESTKTNKIYFRTEIFIENSSNTGGAQLKESTESFSHLQLSSPSHTETAEISTMPAVFTAPKKSTGQEKKVKLVVSHNNANESFTNLTKVSFLTTYKQFISPSTAVSVTGGITKKYTVSHNDNLKNVKGQVRDTEVSNTVYYSSLSPTHFRTSNKAEGNDHVISQTSFQLKINNKLENESVLTNNTSGIVLINGKHEPDNQIVSSSSTITNLTNNSNAASDDIKNTSIDDGGQSMSNVSNVRAELMTFYNRLLNLEYESTTITSVNTEQTVLLESKSTPLHDAVDRKITPLATKGREILSDVPNAILIENNVTADGMFRLLDSSTVSVGLLSKKNKKGKIKPDQATLVMGHRWAADESVSAQVDNFTDNTIEKSTLSTMNRENSNLENEDFGSPSMPSTNTKIENDKMATSSVDWYTITDELQTDSFSELFRSQDYIQPKSPNENLKIFELYRHQERKKTLAFNFVISGLSAMGAFLLGLLAICCIRRYQQQGSYVLANENDFDLKLIGSEKA